MVTRLLFTLLGFLGLRRNGGRVNGLDIGRRFDMKPLVLPWPRCPHIQIGGETGSGKSGVCNSIIGALADHADTAICGIDLKLVELSPWHDRLTVLATTPAEADRTPGRSPQPDPRSGRVPTLPRSTRVGSTVRPVGGRLDRRARRTTSDRRRAFSPMPSKPAKADNKRSRQVRTASRSAPPCSDHSPDWPASVA